MDDERKDMANAGGDKKNNHKEITKGATETEKPSETAQPPQDFSTSHGFSTAQQKEEQPAVDSAFSLEKILQMEKIPGIHVRNLKFNHLINNVFKYVSNFPKQCLERVGGGNFEIF